MNHKKINISENNLKNKQTNSTVWEGICNICYWKMFNNQNIYIERGFSGDSDSKESTCDAGVPGLILGLGIFPGEGTGYPLWYSCPGNPMDRGAW